MRCGYQGLFAATLTPMRPDGSIAIERVADTVDFLIAEGVAGLYVCGSTGEGVSLSSEERQALAAEFVRAADQRIPVLVQVGHNSLTEARKLATHAASIGANAVSATCPSYFKVNTVETLVDCMVEVAAGAPSLPFYYYHIPSLTGNKLSMPEFLKLAEQRINNLAGIKFTTPEVHEFQKCLMQEDPVYDVFWGVDEMLLSALVVGAPAAIGSTYNIATPLYKKVIAAFRSGDMANAAHLQMTAVHMIDVLLRYPFHAALKQVMEWQGMPIGRCRLPQLELSSSQSRQLRQELEALGFFEWSATTP